MKLFKTIQACIDALLHATNHTEYSNLHEEAMQVIGELSRFSSKYEKQLKEMK